MRKIIPLFICVFLNGCFDSKIENRNSSIFDYHFHKRESKRLMEGNDWDIDSILENSYTSQDSSLIHNIFNEFTSCHIDQILINDLDSDSIIYFLENIDNLDLFSPLLFWSLDSSNIQSVLYYSKNNNSDYVIEVVFDNSNILISKQYFDPLNNSISCQGFKNNFEYYIMTNYSNIETSTNPVTTIYGLFVRPFKWIVCINTLSEIFYKTCTGTITDEELENLCGALDGNCPNCELNRLYLSLPFFLTRIGFEEHEFGKYLDNFSCILNVNRDFYYNDCTDSDLDGIPDFIDNCPGYFNPAQLDSDGDGFGDICDNSPFIPNANPFEIGFLDQLIDEINDAGCEPDNSAINQIINCMSQVQYDPPDLPNFSGPAGPNPFNYHDDIFNCELSVAANFDNAELCGWWSQNPYVIWMYYESIGWRRENQWFSFFEDCGNWLEGSDPPPPDPADMTPFENVEIQMEQDMMSACHCVYSLPMAQARVAQYQGLAACIPDEIPVLNECTDGFKPQVFANIFEDLEYWENRLALLESQCQ